MRGRRRTLRVLAATVLPLAGACSPTDEVASTPTDPNETITTATTAAGTTVETTTTVPQTTTTTPEASTTAVPATTTTTTTTAEAATTTEATALVDLVPASTPPALAYASGDTALVEIDTATGSVTRTVIEFFTGDGVFRGTLRLSPDGATLWFSEGYEDGWFGCETSIGSIGRVDVATGAVEMVATGFGVDPSPDGSAVVYLTSDLCLPDPENPEFWVLTPYDRVVVRDVAVGTEREIVTAPAPADYESPSQVTWVGYAPDGGLLVQTGDGQFRLVDPAGSAVLQDHPVILPEVRGVPVGFVGGALITIDYGDEGSADLYAVGLDQGATALLATSEGFLTAGLAANGAIVVAGFTDVDVEPGAPVTVLTAPAGSFFYDVDW